jgi:hypothetical protein
MIRIAFLIIFLIVQCSAIAQNFNRANVLKMNIRSAGPILQNEQVKGYYFFYRTDKKDYNTSEYLLTVCDENLREINSITITQPRSMILVEAAFNGASFGFLFYDSRSRYVELVAYDKTLKEIGSVRKLVSNKFLAATYKSIAVGNEPSQAFLVPVRGLGFMYYGLKMGNKMHFEMEFFDNTMKSVWSHKVSDNQKSGVHLAAEAFQSERFIGSVLTSRASRSATNVETQLEVRRTDTGELVFRAPLKTDKYTISFADVTYNWDTNDFTVFGEYFAIGDNEMKASSLGFIAMTFDITGKMTNVKTNSWLNEISKAAPVNERGKFDGNNTHILFHNIIRTSDGKVFVIGEQYKKAASAAGIISTVLLSAAGGSSQMSTVQLNVYNMVVFEFNPDYSLNKVHVFEKDKNVMQLPAGYGSLAPRLLSYYAKTVGGFDYAFTQVASDKNTFYVSYINYDREQGQRSKNVLGTIVYTPEKVFTVDKLPLSRRSTSYYVYKGKEGYVLITEYFRSEKRMESRLEKVNY